MKKNNNAIKNIVGSISVNMTNALVTFISQRIFLHILNVEYLGLNNLFTNIISVLNIFELGIGTAITFSLYKPLAEKDDYAIKGLLNFYKKAYRIIFIIVSSVGLAITPFIPLFIKDNNIDVNVYVAYLVFVADVAVSYLFAYRRSILYADQKNYIISVIHISYLILMNVTQLIVLSITKNYYLYLIIKVIMRLIENLAIHYIAKKQYSQLVIIRNEKLDKDTEKSILKKAKALLFHKIGTFIVNGTDNIIMSAFIGLSDVGLYSNYYVISNAIMQFIGQATLSLTPTIGHKLAITESRSTFESFKRLRFICFCLACIASVCFMTCSQELIIAWLGDEYVLGYCLVIAISVNLYQKLQRSPYQVFKDAAGIFYEDRFIPLVESIINIIASIVLLKIFGIAGVILGTIVSGLSLWCYSYPKFVYKKLFKRNYLDYIKETIGYAFVFVVCAVLSFGISSLITFDNTIIQIIYNGIMSVLVCSMIIIIVLHKTTSYKYISRAIRHKMHR